jgi:hypothetical protein
MMVSPPAAQTLAQRALHRGQFLVDLVLPGQRGDLVGQARRAAFGNAQRIGAAFGIIDPAFELVEPGQGLVHALAGHQAAQADAVFRAFQAGSDRRLAAARLAQAGLELFDVLLIGAHRIVEHGHFARSCSAMSAAFLRSTSAARARSSRSFDSASWAFSAQSAWSRSSLATWRSISFWSAMVRAAEARTSTSVSPFPG